MRRLRGSERGAAAVELALLAPVVLLVVAVMVGGVRVWFVRGAVTDAAYAAARAATLEHAPAAAQARGDAAARAGLADVPCADPAIAIDTSGFAVAVGQPAAVTASISCAVRLGDLVGLGAPGAITVAATSTSVLDTYRRRQ